MAINYIYKITAKGFDECYIGISINVNRRFKQHLTKLALGTHSNKALQSFYDNKSKDLLIEIIDQKENYATFLELSHIKINPNCINKR